MYQIFETSGGTSLMPFLLFIIVLLLLAYLYFQITKLSKEAQSKQIKKVANDGKKKSTLEVLINSDCFADSQLNSIEQFSWAIGHFAYDEIKAVQTQKELREQLSEQWSMNFNDEALAKDRIIYTLQKIWSEGSTNLLLKNMSLAGKVSIRDLVALDCSRFVVLIRQALMVDLIAEQEAWGLLFLNAQRVQDCYDSWQDFAQCYQTGRDFYNEHYDVKDAIQIQEVKFQWPKEAIFSHLISEEPIKESIDV